MNCCDSFGKTLHYVSPAHGGWGVVRIAALVPESHQLFVAPFACGRHGALGGAVNGIKERISYLYIDESDIISGGYEDLIPDAVDELLSYLMPKPKVLFIFVSCLDDLLGTDHVQLNKLLTKQHPDIVFRTCHMNPISLDTKFPPGITLQNNIYSLLAPAKQTIRSVNMIGNNVSVDPECEFFLLMQKQGYQIKHIADFQKFEDFKGMADSQLNILLSPVAKYAATVMEKQLEIPFAVSYVTYDLKEIASFYDAISIVLGIPLAYQSFENSAKAKLEEASQMIGDFPIAIDYQAVKKPFTLAKMLLEYGFQVKLLMTDGVKDTEKDACSYIQEHFPQVLILNAVHPELVKAEYHGLNYLCIGFDCGYATGSDRVVDLLDDEGLFGFYGTGRLMDSMITAYQNKTNLQEIIEEAGLII